MKKCKIRYTTKADIEHVCKILDKVGYSGPCSKDSFYLYLSVHHMSLDMYGKMKEYLAAEFTKKKAKKYL